MLVDLSNLDGQSLGQADLTRNAAGQLMLDATPVITVRIIGSRTALVLAGKQVCVPTTDYAQIRYTTASAFQDVEW